MQIEGNIVRAKDSGAIILNGEYAQLVLAAVQETSPPNVEELSDERKKLLGQLATVEEQGCSVISSDTAIVAADSLYVLGNNLIRQRENVPKHRLGERRRLNQEAKKLSIAGSRVASLVCLEVDEDL